MDANDRLVLHHCWCGIEHAIPNNLDKTAREEGKGVFCPLGHIWVMTKSETQKLRERLNARDAQLRSANSEKEYLERKVRRLENKLKPKKKKRGKHDAKKGD